MKKIFIIYMLFISAIIYGQSKNAVFLSLGSPTTPILTQWQIGFGYEHGLNEKTAILITGDFAENKKGMVDNFDYDKEKTTEIDVLARFRYYPFHTALDKLFIEAGAGYTFLSLTAKDRVISNLFALQGDIGWKFILKSFFIQPWLGYNISFGKFDDVIYDNYGSSLRKNGYVNFGFNVGFVF